MCDRDDANLKQFKSRSAQPKMSCNGAARPTSQFNVVVVYDNPFGDFGDRNDNLRFKYMGTSPMASQYEAMHHKRTMHNVMSSTYDTRI